MIGRSSGPAPVVELLDERRAGLRAARGPRLRPPPPRLVARGRARVRVQACADARGRLRELAEGAARAAPRRFRFVARAVRRRPRRARAAARAPLRRGRAARGCRPRLAVTSRRSSTGCVAGSGLAAARRRARRVAATTSTRASRCCTRRVELEPDGTAQAELWRRSAARTHSASAAPSSGRRWSARSS